MKAVFLDRDGTLIEETGYANAMDQIIIYPYAALSLELLKRAGFLLIVVSNQAGVAKGLVDPSFPDAVVAHLQERLRFDAGPAIDGGYHCPHHSEGTVPHLARRCDCRKPEIGMIERAASDFQIDLSGSYLVGDHLSDVEAAHRAGMRGVLLMTGHGADAAAKLDGASPAQRPDFIAADLLHAARWILRQTGPEQRA